MIAISEECPARAELLALYGSVGWSAYTDDPDRLVAAITNSTWVLIARDAGGSLVGLLRVVSDRATIAYVQDVLVAPGAQRSGVGGALLDAALERCAGIRQVVLLTDDEDGQRRFYESRGLREIRDLEPAPLRAFVRLGG